MKKFLPNNLLKETIILLEAKRDRELIELKEQFHEVKEMPIFMVLHIVPGVNAKDVAEAHSKDVYLEKHHNCKCITY
jgi:hypothetical protein